MRATDNGEVRTDSPFLAGSARLRRASIAPEQASARTAKLSTDGACEQFGLVEAALVTPRRRRRDPRDDVNRFVRDQRGHGPSEPSNAVTGVAVLQARHE